MKAENDNTVPFLSVCAGIEAASVAWHPLGWRACLLSEIEKFPRRILAHHYPATRLWGDLTALRVRHLRKLGIPLPAILVGGTPCQAFSVAGLRRSLADARGNLTLSFVRLAHALANTGSLRNVVWENVPGVLSTKDNAFGCFLGAIVGADDAIPPPGGRSWPNSGMVSGPKGRAAWAVKDAQYFGLAQRRRRVFVVVDFGNGADPAAVLFEPVGVLGNPAPSREARKDVAGTVAGGARKGGGYSTDDVPLTAALSVALSGRDGGATAELGDEVGGTLRASSGGGDKPHVLTFAPDIARCVATREGNSQDYETTTMVAVDVAPTVRAGGNKTGGDRPYGTDVDTCDSLATVYSIMPQNSGKDFKARVVDVAQPLMAGGPVGGNQGGDVVCVTGTVTHTLRAEGFDASEDGTGRGNPIVAMRESGQGYWVQDAIAGTLRAEGENRPSRPSTVIQQAVAIHENQRSEVSQNDTAGALGRGGGKPGQGYPATFTGSAVRRLTPRECERLQGFPDDYTLPPGYDADGPRYKALGNSMAVPVMRWIGGRIALHMPAANDNSAVRKAA
ncbi:DNA cytosine methyltransferase [Bosea sp. LjRoot237]|uniref:DNA cytosine methyltransferase n=1 Tax=Bosea sp. LjRoot237 TaxID=3342292 RepID=UPI003ECE7DD3